MLRASSPADTEYGGSSILAERKSEARSLSMADSASGRSPLLYDMKTRCSLIHSSYVRLLAASFGDDLIANVVGTTPKPIFQRAPIHPKRTLSFKYQRGSTAVCPL